MYLFDLFDRVGDDLCWPCRTQSIRLPNSLSLSLSLSHTHTHTHTHTHWPGPLMLISSAGGGIAPLIVARCQRMSPVSCSLLHDVSECRQLFAHCCTMSANVASYLLIVARWQQMSPVICSLLHDVSRWHRYGCTMLSSNVTKYYCFLLQDGRRHQFVAHRWTILNITC